MGGGGPSLESVLKFACREHLHPLIEILGPEAFLWLLDERGGRSVWWPSMRFLSLLEKAGARRFISAWAYYAGKSVHLPKKGQIIYAEKCLQIKQLRKKGHSARRIAEALQLPLPYIKVALAWKGN